MRATILRLLSVSLLIVPGLLAAGATAVVDAQNQGATPDVTRLIAQLDDPAQQFNAMRRLAQAGGAAVPGLRSVAMNRRGYARVLAARALRAGAPQDLSATAALLAAAHDVKDPLAVRRYAVYALALSPTSLPAVSDLLAQGDAFNRRSAAFALLEMHAVRSALPETFAQPLDDTVPILITALGDADDLVRGVAIECLEQIDGFDQLLLEATRSKTERARRGAEDVMTRRKSEARIRGSKPLQLKPDALDTMKGQAGMLSGHLGIIYARLVGGEPVEDFRAVAKPLPPTSSEPLSVRVTVNSTTMIANSGLSRFNPYADLQ